jgi:hypothetical protein
VAPSVYPPSDRGRLVGPPITMRGFGDHDAANSAIKEAHELPRNRPRRIQKRWT